jgi:hypothetical protein
MHGSEGGAVQANPPFLPLSEKQRVIKSKDFINLKEYISRTGIAGLSFEAIHGKGGERAGVRGMLGSVKTLCFERPAFLLEPGHRTKGSRNEWLWLVQFLQLIDGVSGLPFPNERLAFRDIRLHNPEEFQSARFKGWKAPIDLGSLHMCGFQRLTFPRPRQSLPVWHCVTGGAVKRSLALSVPNHIE